MSVNISRKMRKDKKNKQTNAFCKGKTDQKCAGCSEKAPEYVFDDRQLCLDCYIAEIHYCDKELIQAPS